MESGRQITAPPPAQTPARESWPSSSLALALEALIVVDYVVTVLASTLSRLMRALALSEFCRAVRMKGTWLCLERHLEGPQPAGVRRLAADRCARKVSCVLFFRVAVNSKEKQLARLLHARSRSEAVSG